jgi:O-acetylhomoserine (thiol)-lyase
LSEAEQRAAGVPPDMVRLSIGIETLADIVWDLEQALDKAAA